MLKKALRIWMSFWKIIGTINTYIILSIVFFLLVTPLGIIMRLIMKNPFQKGDEESYWIRIDEKNDMERQF